MIILKEEKSNHREEGRIKSWIELNLKTDINDIIKEICWEVLWDSARLKSKWYQFHSEVDNVIFSIKETYSKGVWCSGRQLWATKDWFEYEKCITWKLYEATDSWSWTTFSPLQVIVVNHKKLAESSGEN